MNRLTPLLLAAALALFSTFLFGWQAFFNYYYFVAALLLMAVIVLAGEGASWSEA